MARAATNIFLLFPISTQTQIMSSTKTSHLPQSSTGNVILIFLAKANGIESLIYFSSGTLWMNLECDTYSFQSGQAKRSLIVSVMISDMRQKSSGQEDPPIGNCSETMIYLTLFILT